MRALIILQHQKWGLSPKDRSCIEAALELKNKGIITHSKAICIIKEPHPLQYALALGIDQAIQIDLPKTTSYNQATLIKPYTQDIDCIFVSDHIDIHGHLGQILAGMLRWQHSTQYDHVSSQSVISISHTTTPKHPAISNLLDHNPFTEHIEQEDIHTLLETSRTKPQGKLFQSPNAFIETLIEDGILL